MYPPPPQTGHPQAFGNGTGPRAGFWQRFAAVFIDGLVIGIVPVILVIVAAASSGSRGLVVLAYLIGIVGGIAYEVYFIGGPTGQTLGKKAMGIRVIDYSTGGPLGYGRAFLRLIGRYVSGMVCYLGYLWMLWDDEKQCWHDKMANDVVVPEEYYPVPG
jgi:uncharacterized RDD family membrane protein YckC